MIPVTPLTNEPQYDVLKEEPGLGESTITSLLERTKQKGRGEALKTVLQETQTHGKAENTLRERVLAKRKGIRVGIAPKTMTMLTVNIFSHIYWSGNLPFQGT